MNPSQFSNLCLCSYVYGTNIIAANVCIIFLIGRRGHAEILHVHVTKLSVTDDLYQIILHLYGSYNNYVLYFYFTQFHPILLVRVLMAIH